MFMGEVRELSVISLVVLTCRTCFFFMSVSVNCCATGVAEFVLINQAYHIFEFIREWSPKLPVILVTKDGVKIKPYRAHIASLLVHYFFILCQYEIIKLLKRLVLLLVLSHLSRSDALSSHS